MFGLWCESFAPSKVWFVSDKSKYDLVFRSNAKTLMSNASFHSFNSRSDGLWCDFTTNKPKILMSNTSFCNFNSRLDGLQCDFSRNKLKYSSYLSTSEPCGKNSAPRILWVFIRPPAKFWQFFASPVLEKSRFFLLRPNFRPYTRGPLGCLLGFWLSGPKPCGGKNHSQNKFLTFCFKDKKNVKFIKNTFKNTLLKKGIVERNFPTKISYGT